MYLAEVWIEYTAAALDRPFTYACYKAEIQRGKRVEVMFNHKKCIGFVESVQETSKSLEELSLEKGYQLSVIETILDREPLINEELFAMAKWMAEETVSSRIACFQAMLPAKLKPSGGDKKIKMEDWVEACRDPDEDLTIRQKEMLQYLKEKGPLLLKQWRSEAKSIGKVLEERGFVLRYQKEAGYRPTETYEKSEPLVLKPLQQKAIEEIKAADQSVVLLHGVTGSGKTEVYLQMAAEVIAAGRQVLILVPEISLTPQMVKRVKGRFGERVAIYHSGLNNQEKYEQFKRVKNGECDVVVGTRSAVFMPFFSLGLIVLDEEHDSSYKQDSLPQYHCRDAAIWRAKYHHCKVILGSATPSLYSYARALKQVYRLVEMPQRINERLPKVITVSTREALKRHESYVLTDTLKKKIDDRLRKKEQVLLMLNRRGYSPTIRCNSCGESLQCPHCDLALTWHQAEGMLKCHMCGYSRRMIKNCPQCGSDSFSMLGIGTQRLEEEIKKEFPSAKVERMDADTTSRKNAHEKILGRLERQETDILIGTQIIAKGIDYPEVTLVGIVNGDAGLNRSDFSSVETSFQLITQAAGRSGRHAKDGEVIIQAFDPEHYAIQYGARQDYKGFFVKEMNFRHLANNPPYSYLISLVFSGRDKAGCLKEAHQFSALLKSAGSFKILGPSELFKLQDQYRFRIILKGKNREEMINSVHSCLKKSLKQKMKSHIKIDTSPIMLE